MKEVNESKKELLEKRKKYDPRKRAMDGDAGTLMRSRSANKVTESKIKFERNSSQPPPKEEINT